MQKSEQGTNILSDFFAFKTTALRFSLLVLLLCNYSQRLSNIYQHFLDARISPSNVVLLEASYFLLNILYIIDSFFKIRTFVPRFNQSIFNHQRAGLFSHIFIESL